MQIARRSVACVERSIRREAERNALMLLLREVLGEEVRLEHLPDGRPVLPAFPDKYLSISHTEGLVMLALSDRPIGLDVERRSRSLERAVSRLVAPALYRLMASSDPSIRTNIYGIAWTAMEALYKLVPESIVLSDFDYVPRTFILNPDNTFSLRAIYKKIPDVPLIVRGVIEDRYIYSVAEYL